MLWTLVILGTLSHMGLAELNQAPVSPSSPNYYRTEEGCICPMIYAPVCATDSKTYGNSCALKCVQQRNPYLLGVCKGECPCCKEIYHNDPFPIPFPPFVPGDGWGSSITMGSSLGRWGLGPGPIGMSFPYWNRGYNSPSFPLTPSVSSPSSQGNFIRVVSSKTTGPVVTPSQTTQDLKSSDNIGKKSKDASANVVGTSLEETVEKPVNADIRENQIDKEENIVETD